MPTIFPSLAVATALTAFVAIPAASAADADASAAIAASKEAASNDKTSTRCVQIGDSGKPMVTLTMTLTTPTNTISGSSTLKQGSFTLQSTLRGVFHESQMDKQTSLAADIDGYPTSTPSKEKQALPENLKLSMTLSDGTGTADYSYMGADGSWTSVKSSTAKNIDCSS